MINIQSLSQSYGKKQVLKDVSLNIVKKERCALVGRNGSGKSTLIHTMLGILPFKNGTITLNGHPVKKNKWKKDVAYLPEKFHLYPHLTAKENLHFFASLQDKRANEQKIESVLQQVNLLEVKDEKVNRFSKGMLQRLGLALMLYYDAKLLILDEPTSGLDPIGRAEILEVLQSLDDKTIFLSSHHIDEIQQVCTHVAYLEDGKMTKYTVEEFMKVMKVGGGNNNESENQDASNVTSFNKHVRYSRM
ncbi:ABC transporter ATP-binding protein [Bacillus shivajii]|uniref:ABC transporter ATP-binding protein n=1 Tax=Bacillus shivajii TaxID=1983719 RepID=UPI001CFADE69|nr:ABC transporter ATP-binding protein [Bacillus shivajii]UCZ54052.1 ABC transporter ATP-binding protein [Bacillus shivajii]